jgi:hypothetical protein
MRNSNRAETVTHTETMPRVALPPYEPPSPAELERRQQLIEEARRLRESIGPIGIATDDLIHLARDDDS